MYSFEKEFYQVALTGAAGLVGISSQIPNIILNGYEPINGSIMSMGVGTAMAAGMRLPNRYRKWKIFHDVMEKPEFKNEKKLYLEYVRDIAKFLKSLGVSGDLTGAYLCKMCIDGGIFSEEKVKFASFKKDYYDHFVDIMGARVATGAFCCRHAASLVTDVINEMGGVACDVSVYRSEVGEKEEYYPNHLITGLVHNGKGLLFDASVPSFLLSIAGAIELRTKKGKIVAKSFDGGLSYVERDSEFDSEKINKKNNAIIKKCEAFDMNEDMLGEYLEAFTIYLRNIDKIEDFKEKEMPKIKRLSKLNKVIIPHSEIEKMCD